MDGPGEVAKPVGDDLANVVSTAMLAVNAGGPARTWGHGNQIHHVTALWDAEAGQWVPVISDPCAAGDDVFEALVGTVAPEGTLAVLHSMEVLAPRPGGDDGQPTPERVTCIVGCDYNGDTALLTHAESDTEPTLGSADHLINRNLFLPNHLEETPEAKAQRVAVPTDVVALQVYLGRSGPPAWDVSPYEGLLQAWLPPWAEWFFAEDLGEEARREFLLAIDDLLTILFLDGNAQVLEGRDAGVICHKYILSQLPESLLSENPAQPESWEEARRHLAAVSWGKAAKLYAWMDDDDFAHLIFSLVRPHVRADILAAVPKDIRGRLNSALTFLLG